MMKTKHVLEVLAAILLYTALAPADSQLLVSSKCKLLEVKTRIVVTELPTGARVEHIARDIKITVPMRTRVNISDPTSPIQTKFVYKISDFCKNCTPKSSPLVPQCNPKPPPIDECYAHENKTCGHTQRREVSLWHQTPTVAPVETTVDLSSISDAP
ncbi:immunoglobulin J chain-like [Scyliorhinus canicula]|uniref:immunoglobulin J chain-like n=1 Tax=Scyliorhinus canicula TaxID=7830 RepID=UPI0018F597CE|nr:immunoglobulin J chain-like [Scyliorhinus canicula]